MSEAISALQREFPEHSADTERAGRIFTTWSSGFGKTHTPKEGYASNAEAEFPWLFSHEGYVKYAVASWMNKYWS